MHWMVGLATSWFRSQEPLLACSISEMLPIRSMIWERVVELGGRLISRNFPTWKELTHYLWRISQFKVYRTYLTARGFIRIYHRSRTQSLTVSFRIFLDSFRRWHLLVVLTSWGKCVTTKSEICLQLSMLTFAFYTEIKEITSWECLVQTLNSNKTKQTLKIPTMPLALIQANSKDCEEPAVKIWWARDASALKVKTQSQFLLTTWTVARLMTTRPQIVAKQFNPSPTCSTTAKSQWTLRTISLTQLKVRNSSKTSTSSSTN